MGALTSITLYDPYRSVAVTHGNWRLKLDHA